MCCKNYVNWQFKGISYNLMLPTAILNQIQPNPDNIWTIRSLLLAVQDSFVSIYKLDKVESTCFRVLYKVQQFGEIIVKWHPRFENCSLETAERKFKSVFLLQKWLI